MDIKINTKTYNVADTVKSALTGAKSAREALGVAVNVAALAVVDHGNVGYLNQIAKAHKLKSGKQSATGKLIRAYVIAHVKGVKFDEGKAQWSLGNKGLDGVELKAGRKFCTLAEFENRDTSAEAKPVKPMTMAALIKRLESLPGEIEKKGITAEAGELAALLPVLDAIQKAAALAIVGDDTEAETVDVVAVDKLISLKPTTRERAAH